MKAVKYLLAVTLFFPALQAQEGEAGLSSFSAIDTNDSGPASDYTSAVKDSTGEESSVYSLDRTIVTATRTRRRVSETPASVCVVTRDEIDASPAKNIGDLIDRKPGVQMKRVVNIGEGIPSDIIVRGIPGTFGSSRTLVLVDDIPTNASGTPFMILNEVPLDAISQVEIVRGPYSALYGANAFGGVINVLTEDGDGRPGGMLSVETGYPFSVMHGYAVSEKPMTESLKDAGRNTLWKVNCGSSGGNERVNYLASAGFINVGNYLLRDFSIARMPNDTIHKKNENYDYREFTFFGKLGTTVGERARLKLNARYFNSDLGFGKTKKILPDSMDIITRGEKILVGPTADIALSGSVDLHMGGFYRRVNGEFWNEEMVTDNSSVRSFWRSSSDDFQIDSRVLVRAGERNTVTAGADVLRNAINFGAMVNPLTDDTLTDSTMGSIVNAGVFVQDEIAFFERLNIVPGIRYDYQSNFGGSVSPKLGVSYRIIDELRVRSSVGRAFHAPSLSELYMPDLTIRPGFVIRSNPDLQPEYLVAVDGGLEFLPLSSVRISLGGYYNDMKDLIIPGFSPSDQTVTHRNISRAWSSGIELESEWQPLEWLKVSLGYVFQKTKDEYATDIHREFGEKDPWVSLDYIPEHAAVLDLLFKKRLGRILLEGSLFESFTGVRKFQEWTFVLERGRISFDNIMPPVYTLPPYWRTDIGVKCGFGEHAWIGLNVQNLFDASYEESFGTLAPGRFATVSVGGEI